VGLLDKIFGGGSSSLSSMSDSQLQRTLDRGVGRNTGESVATRAAQIREGAKRGITPNKK